MANTCELDNLSKQFGATTALDQVSLAIPERRVVGLIGRNGGGKTTLLHTLTGMVLPSAGHCRTFGLDVAALGADELARIGVVYQENRFLQWMSVAQHLGYVASFYQAWDTQRQQKLLAELELDPEARVGNLSPGDVQKLGLILAVCHHPDLLLLDEPISAVDPIARERLLAFLLDLLQEDACTIVISSHILRDIEQIVDWIVCLDQGRVRADSALDDLQERYTEWTVTSQNGPLPARFDEPFIRRQESAGAQAQLVVRDAADAIDGFSRAHSAEITARPLNLERMFPLLLEDRP